MSLEQTTPQTRSADAALELNEEVGPEDLAELQFEFSNKVFNRVARGELGRGVQERMAQTYANPMRRVLMGCKERPENFVRGPMAQISDGRVNPEARPVDDPVQMAGYIKEFARLVGADLVGITRMNARFVYRGNEVPHRTAIVIAKAMDFDKVRLSPSWITNAAVSWGYVQVADIVGHIAAYIRELGYPARAHHRTREDVLHVPLAVNAGLGELGRNGILVTAIHGPRVRLATVTTDLPLATDQPVNLGVEAFCRECMKCADVCPSNSIPRGEKVILRGAEKWAISPESCIKFWASRPDKWASCANCIMACPWNKPDVWYHRWATRLARSSALGRKALIWLDDRLYGRKPSFTGRWMGYEKGPGLGGG